MSYAIQVGIVAALQADPTIQGLVPKDADGKPSIYPYHARTAVDMVFPIVTVARFGNPPNENRFTESDIAWYTMRGAKLAICIWDKNNIDTCHAIFERVLALLLDPNTPALGSQYISYYKFRRTLMRDDLFDTSIDAYHLHSEWEVWGRANALLPYPIPIPA